MAKNKKIKFSPKIARNVILLVLFIFIIVFIYRRTADFFIRDPLFVVKEVMVEPSLAFIKSDDLARAKGKNIFLVDILRIERKLRFQYPQITDLRVFRKFPDQIFVSATKLNAVAQIYLKKNFFTIDDQEVILSVSQSPLMGLAVIKGVELQQSKIILGRALKDEEVAFALKTIKLFNKSFSRWRLTVREINISNSSKVEVFLSNNLKIIIDQINIADKIKMLGMLLMQNKLDLRTVTYIDMRFPQPVVGHK